MKYLKLTAFAIAVAVIGLSIPTSAKAASDNDLLVVEPMSGFQECLTLQRGEVAQETSLGSDLGEGISEVVTEELREVVNQGLSGVGKNLLPEETAALRYLVDGRTLAVDATGTQVAEISAADPNAPSGEFTINDSSGSMRPADVLKEVKRIVGACLGFGGTSGMTFEQLVRWLGNPANAAKFVIRRIGLVGAVSCIGGVIWSYI